MAGLRIEETPKRLTLAVVLAAALLAGSGCSVVLRDQPLASPPQTFSDPIAVRSHAEGIGQQVGWGRWTVFSLPFNAVHIIGDGNEEVMKLIAGALRHCGYQVSVVSAQEKCEAPVLSCRSKKFWFNNYTWLFPIVPTWGGIILDVTLSSPDGAVLWNKEFTGKGSTLNFGNGYTIAANEAMKSILDQMVQEFTGAEFHGAVTRK